MKRERLSQAACAIWLGVAVAAGAHAVSASNEAITAETTATVLEGQGNPHVAEWRTQADTRRNERNDYLALLAVDLGVLAAFGASISSSAERRNQDTPSVTTKQ